MVAAERRSVDERVRKIIELKNNVSMGIFVIFIFIFIATLFKKEKILFLVA